MELCAYSLMTYIKTKIKKNIILTPRGDLTKIDHKGIILCVVAPFPIRSLDELRSPFTCNVTRRNLTTSCHQKLQQSQITSPQPLYTK